jgi:uracil-DNA glycosylase
MSDFDQCNRPYGLHIDEEVARRKGMLNDPELAYIAPLKNYVQAMRDGPPVREVPDFDPCDGGTNASILILLQDPGPQVNITGFISRNNPDPTAANLCNILSNAGISRDRTIIWNVIPWHLDGQRLTQVERQNAVLCLEGLLRILQNLEFIFVCGRSETAVDVSYRLTSREMKGSTINWSIDTERRVERDSRVICTVHPGDRNRNIRRNEWLSIYDEFVRIR